MEKQQESLRSLSLICSENDIMSLNGIAKGQSFVQASAGMIIFHFTPLHHAQNEGLKNEFQILNIGCVYSVTW